jgi:hypothetical protein
MSYRKAPLHQAQKQKYIFLTLQFVEVCPSLSSHSSLLQNVPARVLLGESHDSSAGVATGWTAENHFPARVSDFSLLHTVETGGSNLAGKATGTLS